MTMLALWYRKDQKDIYAIADSRLTGASGTLTDQAPKFTTVQVRCFGANKNGHYEVQVLNRTIGIGYAGSAAVAFATIATLQAYLSSLTVAAGCKTPRIEDVCGLAKRVLEENFIQFGALWQTAAKCELVIFGFLPTDRTLKAFNLNAGVSEGAITVAMTELPLVEQELCAPFGSASTYFLDELHKEMESTGNFHPFNLLKRIIENKERDDVGGYIQVAIANSSGVMLPHVVTERLDRGEFAADVTFLGRDVSAVGKVGDCNVGIFAVGPDLKALLENRKKAGY